MFNVGGGEILVLLLLALLVLGPERLPKAAGQAGKFIRDIRKMSSGFQQEIQRAMNVDGEDGPFRPGDERLSGPDPGIAEEVKVICSPGPDDPTGVPVMAELDEGDVIDAEIIDAEIVDAEIVGAGSDGAAPDESVSGVPRTDGPPPRLPPPPDPETVDGTDRADRAAVTPLHVRHDGDARAAG